MAEQKLEQSRLYFHCSSSIENFKEKIRKRYGFKEWRWWMIWRPVIFFGLYNPIDYLKFFWHQGQKTVFWCGADIYQLGWVAKLVKKIKAKHIVENNLQKEILMMALGGQVPLVKPQFFGNIDKYEISYKHSDTPHIYLFSHSDNGAEEQSGLSIIEKIAPELPEFTFHILGVNDKKLHEPNIIYHGMVPEEILDDMIKDYQCGLRLHEYDGFSEVPAKSILMGQYPITRIPFPNIDSFRTKEELMELLRNLKEKKEPNLKGREYWYKELSKSLI